MVDNIDSNSDPSQKNIYQFRIKGHLGERWSDGFEGFTITNECDGSTTLTCEMIDQAALHGLIKKIRDLGIPLLSVNRIDRV